VLRVSVLASSTTVACTLGEVVVLALAAGVFLLARRRPRRPGLRH